MLCLFKCFVLYSNYRIVDIWRWHIYILFFYHIYNVCINIKNIEFNYHLALCLLKKTDLWVFKTTQKWCYIKNGSCYCACFWYVWKVGAICLCTDHCCYFGEDEAKKWWNVSRMWLYSLIHDQSKMYTHIENTTETEHIFERKKNIKSIQKCKFSGTYNKLRGLLPGEVRSIKWYQCLMLSLNPFCFLRC